jgi:hypothetical protein
MKHGWKFAVVAGAISLWAAAPAGAAFVDYGTAGGVSYQADRAELTPPSNLNTASDCPEGKHVSGGGFDSEFATGARTFGLQPFDSALDDDASLDDGWAGIVAVPSGSTQDVEIVSICSEDEFTYVRSSNVRLDEQGVKGGSVSCKERTQVVSGGAFLTGTIADSYINSSYPADNNDDGKEADNRWKVRVVNEAGSALSFRVFAVCSKDKITYRSDTETVIPASASGATALCPSTKHLLGLGVKPGGPAVDAIPQSLAPADHTDMDSVPDDYTEAWVVNDVDAVDAITVKAFAMCR